MPPQSSPRRVARALLSVSDKTGLVSLGRGLSELAVELIASGGTAAALRDAGLAVVEVAELTDSPEMLGGRVKTLHPRIHGGILARRDLEQDRRDLKAQGIRGIDLVVVNLYPFEATVSRPDVTRDEAIEKIDIGGPSMIRSAAKNLAYVGVVVDPEDYAEILEELRSHDGALGQETRTRLAHKAFARTAGYDAAIHAYLARSDGADPEALPDRLAVDVRRTATLRYGENPHQHAAVYGRFLELLTPLHGKELSYNNLVDVQAALQLILEFDASEGVALGILKHNTPCGVGTGSDSAQAWNHAFETDRDSPFGGVVVLNRCFDLALAEQVDQIFTEVLLAPKFSEDAFALLKKKKNRRLIRFDPTQIERTELDWKRVFGGVLLQEPDLAMEDPATCPVATTRKPTEDEVRGMRFAWKVAKHVKSNAIVFAGPDRTLAIGGGATSRVDAVHAARAKAARVGNSLAGSVLASDAFFPFSDGLEIAVEAGATAVIQPGGSTRDAEVIEAADRLGIAMVLTGVRHFRH